ncbi:unnamed protein product [Lupinus luteus]|uniref:ABC transporter domain-containing protein n=1 Tax=Lupinus luteus TaxID=3873 RepID=A0AAV1WKE1_LUPLU
MEIGRENEIEDISMSPPSGSNDFGHNKEFLSQAYLRTRYTEIDIQVEGSSFNQNRPLPIFLKFEDVEYKVRNRQAGSNNPVKTMVSKVATQLTIEEDRYKKILKGITGSIGPGEILALMGPSGSGKTTLLRVISGRLQENTKGKITYNDVPYTPAVKRRIGFVAQEDVLFPQLTVEETLVFSALLRLPTNMSKQQKYAKVDTTIKELGLERCRGTKIGGGFLKGISGGERKRTSIGYEILVDPSLLLLDEPTSGLDSTSANKLLLTLQGLAKAGRTIITTIHQPSSRIFHMFDKLLLISEGYPVYYGKARESIEYFSSLRFVPEIPMNPAEFLIDLATGQVNDMTVPADIFEDQESTDPSKAVIKYLQLKYKTLLEPKEKEENHGVANTLEHLQLAIQVKKEWTLSWLDQFMILSRRTFKARCKDYFDKLRLVQALGVALLLGLLWWKSSTNTEAQLRDQGAGEMFGAAVMSIKRSGMAASLILMMFLLTGGYYVQHIPKFMRWLKYMSFMYYGFRLLLKVQYSGDELYDCESNGGCKTLQSSPSFDTVNLKGGLKEVWILLAMAITYRFLAYWCLHRRIDTTN